VTTAVTIQTLSAAAIAAALGQFPPTPEQTAVIEAPLEPALVVAGAGSGKTASWPSAFSAACSASRNSNAGG